MIHMFSVFFLIINQMTSIKSRTKSTMCDSVETGAERDDQ